MVATAVTDSRSAAAAITAAPPKLWPISSWTFMPRSPSARAASTTSAASLDRPPPNSPSLSPSPVKSNRSTPIPRAARLRLTRTAASEDLLQVKQWANTA